MSRLNEEAGVALVTEACPICGKQIEGPILIGKVLNKSSAKKINELNGKCIGFKKEPCPECKALIDNGCFFIIGIDISKTEDIHNPYRSGHIVGIKKDSDFYRSLDPGYHKKDAVYMDYVQMIQIGLIQE